MTVPYTRQLQFDSSDEMKVCVELPAPPRGILTRLIVKQTAGTLGGFSFDVYDRRQACEFTSLSVNDPDAEEGGGVAQGLEPELHMIMDTVTVTAGNEVSAQYDLVRPYVNQDDRDQTQRPTPMLYMTLDPVGGGAKTWQIAYTITSDMD